MKKSSLLLALALIAGLSFVTASAQTLVGTDNFNDNDLGVIGASNRWRFDSPMTGSGTAFTNQNGQLEFTASTTTGHNSRALGWISPASSGGAYGLTWNATVAVSNLTQSSLTSGFTYAGLEAYTLADLDHDGIGDSSNGYYGVYLSTNATFGTRLVSEWGRWDATLNGGLGDWARTTSYKDLTGFTDATLRLTWVDSTQTLYTSYSTDGGATYLGGSIFSLNGAQAGIAPAAYNGFGLELSGVAFDTGTAITAGQIAFDNMAVTAVPEPSTYAALAGVGALGLALWRRRQVRVAAGA